MAIALKEGRAIRNAEAVAERLDETRVPFIPYRPRGAPPRAEGLKTGDEDGERAPFGNEAFGARKEIGAARQRPNLGKPPARAWFRSYRTANRQAPPPQQFRVSADSTCDGDDK
jgi:hypothetical protein